MFERITWIAIGVLILLWFIFGRKNHYQTEKRKGRKKR